MKHTRGTVRPRRALPKFSHCGDLLIRPRTCERAKRLRAELDQANQNAQDQLDQAQQKLDDAGAQQKVDNAQKQLNDIQQQVEDAMNGNGQ